MKSALLITICILYVVTGLGQNKSFDYFGLPDPGNKIELFAPGIISMENSKEYSLTISPFGDEVFFAVGTWPESKIMHVRKTGDKWGEPQIASFSEDCYTVEPAFSPDGKYVYFSSSKGEKDIKQYGIWRAEKVNDKWENAKKVIDITDPDIWEFHPSITNNGTVYFCYWDSKTNIGSIYKSEYLNGNYSAPVKVNLMFGDQSSVVNPFVDPAGKFMITAAKAENSKSDYDSFISYKKENGWSEPVNTGARFNTSGGDEALDVSPDGKYLFIYKEDNIFWTKANGLIK